MKLEIIDIAVDLTDTPRRLLHAAVTLPVTPGTTASFATPLWIQEFHSPDGPVPGISGLFFFPHPFTSAKPLPWRRNPAVPSEYLVTIPPTTHAIRAVFDAIATRRVTRRMIALAWETVLLYPTDRPIERTRIRASITIPREWGVGTALSLDDAAGQGLSSSHGTTRTLVFAPTTVERLADSPVLTGLHFRQFNLSPDARHLICIAADSAPYLAVPPKSLTTLSALVRETLAVAGGARHYGSHHFLLTLSAYAGGGGYEHAESFDGGLGLTDLSDAADVELVAHEFFHSWCGKYRRPCGHRPHDFQTPLDGRLLWVYEGLTQYYGEVLAVRCGGMAAHEYRAKLAWTAAGMDAEAGRRWRSVEDTGAGTSLKPGVAWGNWQRGRGSYYPEGVLVWLTVDTLIRSRSGGRHSLDDWVQDFFGGGKDTGPKVVSYTLGDIVASLGALVCYDWAAFFKTNVQDVAPRALTEGIERAGYELEYSSEPPSQGDSDEKKKKLVGKNTGLADAVWFSLGVRISDTGAVLDVRRFSPADVAGLAPTQTIVKMGGVAFSGGVEQLAEEIKRASREGTLIELVLHQEDDEWDLSVDYQQGLRYPRLKRWKSASDMLAEILAARTSPPDL